MVRFKKLANACKRFCNSSLMNYSQGHGCNPVKQWRWTRWQTCHYNLISMLSCCLASQHDALPNEYVISFFFFQGTSAWSLCLLHNVIAVQLYLKMHISNAMLVTEELFISSLLIWHETLLSVWILHQVEVFGHCHGTSLHIFLMSNWLIADVCVYG